MCVLEGRFSTAGRLAGLTSPGSGSSEPGRVTGCVERQIRRHIASPPEKVAGQTAGCDDATVVGAVGTRRGRHPSVAGFVDATHPASSGLSMRLPETLPDLSRRPSGACPRGWFGEHGQRPICVDTVGQVDVSRAASSAMRMRKVIGTGCDRDIRIFLAVTIANRPSGWNRRGLPGLMSWPPKQWV